jgi:transcription elongation factor Elf1
MPGIKCRRRIRKRYFVCPVCGRTSPATATKRSTKPGHIKTMYCVYCNAVRDFTQTE